MAQLILAGIALIGLKLIWDLYNDYQGKSNTKHKKGGQVIDLSEAWIEADNLPYKKKSALLSRTELALFHLLNETIDHDKYVIIPKVRLEEILSSATNINNAEEYLHRLKERSADFLICNLPGLTPQLVILSEGEANSKKKLFSDKFNKRACEEAGLPVMSVDITNLPSSSELASRLQYSGLE